MIKQELGISKSTLSGWLSDKPLPPERIKELQANNPKRIEKFRETMRQKRERRWRNVYKKARKDIGKLTKRELFLAGIFLYWGEGMKRKYCTVSVSNTDVEVIRFFLQWLRLLGVKRNRVRIRLHLYQDMSVEEEIKWWSRKLRVPQENFSRPYIKSSSRKDLTYSNVAMHGTCNAEYYDRDLYEYIMACLNCIQN